MTRAPDPVLRTTPREGPPNQPSLLALVIGSWVEHQRLLFLAPLIVGLIAIPLLLLIPNKYSATVALVPESRDTKLPGELASLAGLAGMNLSSRDPNETPQFYAALLSSRRLRYTLLQRRFPAAWVYDDRPPGDSIPLWEFLEPPGATLGAQLWNAAMLLEQDVYVAPDMRTGIIRLTFTHHSPPLAAGVADAFAEELVRFNRENRQSRARARREFVEGRVSEAADQLNKAEDAQRAFLARNREWQDSPTLLFEHGRLERAVMVQQELFLNLRRELDAARIAEVDNLPALTTIEPAILPERKSSPRRKYWLASLIILTFFGVATGTVLRDHHDRLFPGFASSVAPFANRLSGAWLRVRRPGPGRP